MTQELTNVTSCFYQHKNIHVHDEQHQIKASVRHQQLLHHDSFLP